MTLWILLFSVFLALGALNLRESFVAKKGPRMFVTLRADAQKTFLNNQLESDPKDLTNPEFAGRTPDLRVVQVRAPGGYGAFVEFRPTGVRGEFYIWVPKYQSYWAVDKSHRLTLTQTQPDLFRRISDGGGSGQKNDQLGPFHLYHPRTDQYLRVNMDPAQPLHLSEDKTVFTKFSIGPGCNDQQALKCHQKRGHCIKNVCIRPGLQQGECPGTWRPNCTGLSLDSGCCTI